MKQMQRTMLCTVLFFVVLGTASAPAQGSAPRDATLAQQKMCDVQANKKFNESEASSKSSNSEYTSHYDARANVCYIMVHQGAHGGMVGFSYLVYDAFEGRVYGSYVWVNSENKTPVACWVKPLGQKKIQCKTDDEFEELVDKYFGIGP
jgi:hypothetical protein